MPASSRPIVGSSAGRLVRVAVAYTGLGLLGSIISVLVLWRSTALAWAITDTLRHELARFVLGAELAFHRDDTRDELVSRADDDVTAMAMFLSQFVARAVSVLAISIGAVAALTVMRPELGLVLGVSLTVVLIVVWVQRNVPLAQAIADRDARGRVSGPHRGARQRCRGHCIARRWRPLDGPFRRAGRCRRRRQAHCRASPDAQSAVPFEWCWPQVRNPSVVVLDEATSRVDPVTQRMVKHAVAELLRGRTSALIAHRLDTLDVCDDIAVLEQGRVVEHGESAVLAADSRRVLVGSRAYAGYGPTTCRSTI